MKLVPVQGNPYDQTAASPQGTLDPRLKPVKGNPFGGASSSDDIEHTWLQAADDWARSLGSGAVQGVEGLIGLPGDVEYGANWLEAKGEGLIRGKDVPVIPGVLPTSGDVEKFASDELGLKPYQPKTTFGKYLKTIGEFAPGVVAGEAGNVVKAGKALVQEGGNIVRAAQAAPEATSKLMSSLVKWGAVPAVASEGAAQTANKYGYPQWENVARIAGALAGTGGVAALQKTAPIIAQTIQELDQGSNAIYRAIDQSGVMIKPDSFRVAMTDLALKMDQKGLNPMDPDHRSAYAAVVKLLEKAFGANSQAGQMPMRFSELVQMRQAAKLASKASTESSRYFGQKIRNAIDEYIDGLGPSDIVGGSDPQQVVGALRQANKMYHQMKKGEIIEKLFADAELHSRRIGWTGAIQGQFQNLAKSEKLMRTFAPDEQEAIRAVAIDSTPEKVLRFLGKGAVRGVVSGLGAIATGGVSEVVGEVGRFAGKQIIKGKINRADEIVRGGVPAVRKPVPAAAALAPAGPAAALGGPLAAPQTPRYGFDQGGIVTNVQTGKPAERWRYVNGQYVLTQ